MRAKRIRPAFIAGALAFAAPLEILELRVYVNGQSPEETKSVVEAH